MNNTLFVKERGNLQKLMMGCLSSEIESLDPDLQLILIDDLMTAFYNRLIVMEKVQKNSM